MRPTRSPPRTDRLQHWLDIAEAHWVIDRAVSQAAGVTLDGWLNEWQTITDANGDPTSYVLHTQFREGPKPLSCSPDAAFCLEVAGHRRVHDVEVDRGTTGCRRVAASKLPGYAELLAKQGHRRHFPNTTFDAFAVLVITTSAIFGTFGDRDESLREVKQRHGFRLNRLASRVGIDD